MAADEATLLEALRANANDDDIRLVYADWLEEQGDVRAEYVRLEMALYRLDAKADAPSRLEQEQRLAELGKRIDPEWLAVVCRLPAEAPAPDIRARVASPAPRRIPAPAPTAVDALLSQLPRSGPDAWRSLDGRASPIPTLACKKCGAALERAMPCEACGYAQPSRRRIVLIGLALGVVLIALVDGVRDPKGCLFAFMEREYYRSR